MKDEMASEYVVVTGVSSGIGYATAAKLVEEGIHVLGTVRSEEDAVRVKAELGADFTPVMMDVTDEASIAAGVVKVKETVGEVGLVGLVNNAGIVGPQGPWHNLTEENFDFVNGINFKGMFLCAKAAIPHMIAQKSGKIINISSCAAKTGEENNGMYSATKAAVLNLTQSMSSELGRYNINVNAVCPAAMDTDLMEKVYRERSKYFGMTPDELRKKIKSGFKLPRELTVEDAANVVVFLASKKADMMTGQGVNITGGIEVH